MAEAPSKIESMRKWVVEHKLRAVGMPRQFFHGFVFSARIQLFGVGYLDYDVSQIPAISFFCFFSCYYRSSEVCSMEIYHEFMTQLLCSSRNFWGKQYLDYSTCWMQSVLIVAFFWGEKGCLWLGGISSSIAYNWSRPNMKPSVKIIHARFV